jgi:ribosomal protein L35
LMGTKKPKRMRHLKKATLVNAVDAEHVKRMLPYG